MDVASLGELQHALGAGFTPDRITATGPKNPEFLWLAARTSVTVSVDSREELDQLAALVRAFTLPRVPVLLRLSGFEAAGVRVLSRRSRFGTPVRASDPLLEAVERHRDTVELAGVAYHLDTTASTRRRPRSKAACGHWRRPAREGCGPGPSTSAADSGSAISPTASSGSVTPARSPTPCWAIGHR
ncbi:Diaminopimelate decarboxylase [Streptomyces glaucescens]